MKINIIILTIVAMIVFINNSFSEEKLENCEKNKNFSVENIIKKYSCKANIAYKKSTSKISSKKTLADFFKKKNKE